MEDIANMTPRQQLIAQKAARGIVNNKRHFKTYDEYAAWKMGKG